MAFAFLVFGGRKLLKDTGTDDELASAGHGIPAPSPTPGSESGAVSGTRASTLERTTVTATDSLIPTTTPKLNIFQKVSLISLACLVTLVVVLSALNLPTDVGVLALGLAVLVSILFPSRTKPALRGIDWSTILLVGGIVTYVGVLERVGAMELLGHAAASVNQPLLAAFVICLVGAFISAFASTTGILGALIPLSLPLMATGNFVGYGLIVALALSASLVDTTPFSTAGATAVASAPEEERPRMTKIYMRWGFSMIIIAPILTVTTLVLPTMF
nr:SLC13 family permease [Pseudarthrobacter sp. GA104]